MKKLTALILAVSLSSCGKDVVTQEQVAEHDGVYQIALYSNINGCTPPEPKMVINVSGGAVVSSYWAGFPISGIVVEDSVEAFVDLGTAGTIDILGEFSSSLRGTWEHEKTKCSGYFEEVNR